MEKEEHLWEVLNLMLQ